MVGAGLLCVWNSLTSSSVSCHAWQPLTSFRHLSVTRVFGKCSKTHLRRTCLSLTERYFKHVYGSQNAFRLSLSSSRHVNRLHYPLFQRHLPSRDITSNSASSPLPPNTRPRGQTTLVLPPVPLHPVCQSSSAFVL